MMEIKDSRIQVMERIKLACQRVSRDPAEVNLVGVTKYVSLETT